MLAVIVRPVPVEDPPLGLHPVEQDRARERRQNVDVGQFHARLDQKLHRGLEDRFVVRVRSEDDARIDHDAVVVEALDLVGVVFFLIEGLVHLGEHVGADRFHADEHRHAAALGRQLDHLRLVAEEHGALGAPLDVQFLERRPEFLAVGAVGVVQIVDKGEDRAVLDAGHDAQRSADPVPHGARGHLVEDEIAAPFLEPLDLGDHLFDRPAAGAFAVERRDAAKFAVKMAAPGCLNALIGHVGAVGQQIDPRMGILLHRRVGVHRIHGLELPLLEVVNDPGPELVGLEFHHDVRVLLRFLWTIGGMRAAEADFDPAGAELVGDLVAPRRVAGHLRRNPD